MQQHRDRVIIGVDATWWGGSPAKRQTQWEYLFGAQGGDGRLHSRALDLHPFRNPHHTDYTQANFDADGAALAREIRALHKLIRPFSQAIVAIDAPLEEVSSNLAARSRLARRGSLRYRQCEVALQAWVGEHCDEGWRNGVYIQPGGRIPSRISSLWSALGNTDMKVIEVFPSEAIMFLGTNGHYGSKSNVTVRNYKTLKHGAVIPETQLREMASDVVSGFANLLGTTHAHVIEYCNDIIRVAIEACPRHASGNRLVAKGFDDAIDSGISFLTGYCYSIGEYHSWGDGTDGIIIGPGKGK